MYLWLDNVAAAEKRFSVQLTNHTGQPKYIILLRVFVHRQPRPDDGQTTANPPLKASGINVSPTITTSQEDKRP